jgi:hypothetical protein
MRMRLLVLVIAVAMMLATIQSAAALPVGAFAAKGTVQYEDGTTCPYGWDVWMENLDRPELEGQPWHSITKFVPPAMDYYMGGETVADSDHIQVTITSPDGSYSGTNTMVASEAFDGTNVIINVVVYPQTENFTKSLPAGWNLISLPQTPLDNSTSSVLSGVSYGAVKQYDATTKTFADATTMDPGTGYFVHVTTAGTWEYEGMPVSSTSSGLKAGLNMIGVPNCTMDVGTAMGSADYRYVARWNAVDQKYEVYNPSAPSAFHGFTTMTAGEGYFVSAKSDDGEFTISCPS